MLKVALYHIKHQFKEEFECIQYDIEKGYYKFYLTKSQIKYIPSYDIILDVVYPFELEIEK